MPGWTGIFHSEKNLFETRHSGVFRGFSSHAKRQRAEVFVQGDLYDLPPGESPASFLARSVEEGRLEALLPKLNGAFAAMIHYGHELLLITDRLGMQPIYIWEDHPHFSCATELKAFLNIEGFSPEMDTESLPCFLETGQLLGEKTWFRHVRLLPAATLAWYDLKKMKKEGEFRYWSWSSVKPVIASRKEAVEETGRLLCEAIQKRLNHRGRDILLLSGGLDSRAVLAALPESADILSMTGGQTNAPDVRIAQKAASIRNSPHNWLPLTAENWYSGRLEAVWITEGQISMLHHHFTPFRGDFAAKGKVAWVGFIGDLVVGGSWVRNPDQRISHRSAKGLLGRWAELAAPLDSFFDIPKEDPFWIDTRCRRFTSVGTAWLEAEMPVHKPFIDKDLLEFIYGLPDTFRVNNRLYTATLLQHFPAYFTKLPWQRTGFPIGYPVLTRLALLAKWPGIRRRLGWGRPFVQYGKWIRQNGTLAEEWKSLLDPAQAIYPSYFPENWLEKWLYPHLAGKMDYTEEIGRAITLEYWLRCIFRKENLLRTKD